MSGLRMFEVEEELQRLRESRNLRQQEVNTIDDASLRERNSLKVARARMLKDRSAARAVATRPVAADSPSPPREAEPAADLMPIPSLLTGSRAAPKPLAIGDVELAEGMHIWVTKDVQAIRASSAHQSAADRTKELYCGERGTIAKTYPMLSESQRGVDVRFPDTETRFFTLACLELTAPPKEKVAEKKVPRVAALKARGAARTAPTAAAEDAAPDAAAASSDAAPRVRVEAGAAKEKPEKRVAAPASSRNRSKSTPLAEPKEPKEPKTVKVGQRLLITLNGKTAPVVVKFTGSVEFAEGDWVGLELSTPDGKNNGSVNGKMYFHCKANHGLFRKTTELTGPQRSSSPGGAKKTTTASDSLPKVAQQGARPATRPAAPRLPVIPTAKTVRLWENGQYGSTVDTVPYKAFVVRQVHKTLKSVLNTATRELGWHQLKRSVEILYTEEGLEVADISEIQDGDNLIASWGDAFIPNSEPLPRVKPRQTHVDPMGDGTPAVTSPTQPARPTAPATRARAPVTRATPKAAGGGNRTVKVFENGVYGSNWSDSVPCFTVTIRPAFKTVQSVKTMLARELKWNQAGRKVEYVYNTLGQELTDVGCISHNDVLVASAGDAFIRPHEDMKERLPPPKVSVIEFRAGWSSSAAAAATSSTSDTADVPAGVAAGAPRESCSPPRSLAALRRQEAAPRRPNARELEAELDEFKALEATDDSEDALLAQVQAEIQRNKAALVTPSDTEDGASDEADTHDDVPVARPSRTRVPVTTSPPVEKPEKPSSAKPKKKGMSAEMLKLMAEIEEMESGLSM